MGWGGEGVDAVDFQVELTLGKEGAYVGVIVAFKVWCFDCEVEYAKAAIASWAKKESFGMEVQEVKLVA